MAADILVYAKWREGMPVWKSPEWNSVSQFVMVNGAMTQAIADGDLATQCPLCVWFQSTVRDLMSAGF